MSGIVEQFLYRGQLDDLTGIKNSHAVCDIRNHTQVMGNKYNRVMVFLLKVLDELQDLCLDRNVQSGSRLVTDQDLRLAGKSDCDNDTLSHTAGILEGIIIKTGFRIGNSHLFHHFQGFGSRLHLGTALMLHDNGSNLFSDRDDRV